MFSFSSVRIHKTPQSAYYIQDLTVQLQELLTAMSLAIFSLSLLVYFNLLIIKP